MHRLSGSARVSDEFFSIHSSLSLSAAAAAGEGAMSSSNPKSATTTPDLDHLPTYIPMSHVPKKEKNRFRSAENAVHLIPLLLLLCAIILWFFSSPVDLVNKSVTRVESPLFNSGVDDRGHGNSSLESNLEQEEIDPVNQSTEDIDPVNQSTEDVDPVNQFAEDVDPVNQSTVDVDPVNHSTDSAEQNTIR